MKNRLIKEEKKTPIGKILLRFKYNDLAEPKVRARLEKRIKGHYGSETYKIIQLLEDSHLLPEVINNES